MNVEDLMENVRDFFIEKYPGVEKSDYFLAFEPLGTIIDPEDFEDENEENEELKAREQLSIMSDRLPEIGPTYLTGTSQLSEIYEALVKGAAFTGANIEADDKTEYIAKLHDVQSEAVQKFEDGVKQSLETPEGQYLPVFGSPKRWFDPKGPFWMRKSFSAGTDLGTPPPKKKAEKSGIIPLMWRPKLQISAKAVNAIKAPKPTPKGTPKVQFSSAVMMQPMLLNLKAQTAKPAVKPKSRKIQSRAVITSKPVLSKAVMAQKSKSKSKGKKGQLLMQDLSVLKHLQVAERVRLTNSMAQNNKAPAKPVGSDQFTMSFDYCIVQLHRPWYDNTLFLYRKLWYSLAQEAEFFSTGTKDDTNDGVFKCIPTAMILIKNLKLSASWTEEDKKQAKSSIGLGIFNVNDSVFVGNDLVNPGIQIIGWMCEVMPRMPEVADPNIFG